MPTATEPTFDRRLVAPMVLGSILNPVNSSILAVSLVPIGRAFGAPPSQTAWLVSALYLATAIGQPVMGRLIDVFGPRRLYLVGTATVGVAGVVGLLSPDLWVLVGARVLLGFGTCAGYPASMYLIRAEADRTGQRSPSGVLTVLAVANQTIAVIGPTLGGLLIGIGGWRTTLAVNVPLSLACLWLGSRRLPAVTPTAKADRPGFDLPGIGLFAVALVSGLLFVLHPALPRLWLPVLTVAAAAAFVVREHRTVDPFIDLHVLRGNGPLVRTYARTVLTTIVTYGFLYGFTQWLEEGRGLSPSVAGLVLLPMFGIAILVSSTTGRNPRIRGKLVVGAVFQVLGVGVLLLARPDSPVWLLVAVTAVVGVPQGLLNLANQNALYHQAAPARMGSSAGLLRTAGYLGAVISSAATGRFLDVSPTAGLRDLAVFLAAVSVVGLVLTVADRGLAGVGVRPAD